MNETNKKDDPVSDRPVDTHAAKIKKRFVEHRAPHPTPADPTR